jgi:hypothetical protein
MSFFKKLFGKRGGSPSGKVKFIREERKIGGAFEYVWRIHSAPSRADAIEFLRNTPVTKSFLYIMVDTPEGRVGKDIDIIYDVSKTGQIKSIEVRDGNDDSLASRLASNNHSTFIAALQEAVRYAPQGSDVGLIAMEEAMCRRSGKTDLKFYRPLYVRGRMGTEIAAAPAALVSLAKQGRLLDDPYKSQDLMAACVLRDTEEARKLALQCEQAGGPEQIYAFQLLYNDLRASSKLAHSRAADTQ